MCLITFAYRVHKKFPLILLGNRDEFYQRPTRSAQLWEQEGYPSILAGKDLEAGGTWMGINKDGRWAALTNYRDLTAFKDNAPSRGDLVLNFLKGNNNPQQYLENLCSNNINYNGFNLLVGDDSHLFYYSNQLAQIWEVEPGIHGLSNAFLDTPWPKVSSTKQQLKNAVLKNTISPKNLFSIMGDTAKVSVENLPNTELSLEKEQLLSAIFIASKDYGTRCTSLILKEKNKRIKFFEQNFGEDGSSIDTIKSFVFI